MSLRLCSSSSSAKWTGVSEIFNRLQTGTQKGTGQATISALAEKRNILSQYITVRNGLEECLSL